MDTVGDKVMNHVRYPKSLKKKTVEELLYIQQDAYAAAVANPGNPNAGYYMDEVHYAAAELRRRLKKGESSR